MLQVRICAGITPERRVEINESRKKLGFEPLDPGDLTVESRVNAFLRGEAWLPGQVKDIKLSASFDNEGGEHVYAMIIYDDCTDDMPRR